MRSLGIVGVNIHSQNLNLLESLTIAPEDRVQTLERLKMTADLEELVYLATCNRVEFVFAVSGELRVTEIRNKILDFFFSGNKDIPFSPNDFYLKSGLEAVRHIFTVASALDSLVVGEAQILGQVKDAFGFACENNLAGETLFKIYQHTFRVAKKVRTETDLGKKSVSMVSLVTSLIGQVIQNEGDIPVALVGVGEMTRKLANFLVDRNISDLIFVNRTVEKAAQLSERYGGRAMSLEQFLTQQQKVRIICTATSSTTPIFTNETVSGLVTENDKILFIDLALPRDVAIENLVENRLEIRNISDLKEISERNRRQRFRDVDKARSIVSGEVVRYHKEKIEEELRPVFNQSLQLSREFAEKGLDKLFGRDLPHLEASDRAILTHWVDKLVNYTTYIPSRTLADRIAEQVGADARAEERPQTAASHGHMAAFRKGA